MNEQYGRSLRDLFAPRNPRATRTIILGDSIDADVRGWWPYYSFGTQRIETVRNAGVGGNTTTQMLARIKVDVLDYRPDVVVLGGSTNDVYETAGSAAEAATRANIAAMVEMVRDIGATPVLRTTPPCDIQGGYTSVAARRQAVLRQNGWTYAYANRNGIDVIDIHQSVVDPATGGYLAGITSDGTHPTEVGARAIADYLLALPSPRAFARASFAFGRAVTEAGNLLANGVFVGDANSDGIADGWTAGGSPTGTLNAATTGVTGNWQRIATADTTARYIFQDISTGLAAGDVIQILGRVSSSGTAAALVRLTPYVGGAQVTGQDAVQEMTRPLSNGVFVVRMTMPASVEKLRVMVQVKTAAGWVEVAEMAARNLTALGLT